MPGAFRGALPTGRTTQSNSQQRWCWQSTFSHSQGPSSVRPNSCFLHRILWEGNLTRWLPLCPRWHSGLLHHVVTSSWHMEMSPAWDRQQESPVYASPATATNPLLAAGHSAASACTPAEVGGNSQLQGRVGAPRHGWSALLSHTPACRRGAAADPSRPSQATAGRMSPFPPAAHVPLSLSSPSRAPAGLVPLNPSNGLFGSPLGGLLGKETLCSLRLGSAHREGAGRKEWAALAESPGGPRGQGTLPRQTSYRGPWCARCLCHRPGSCPLQTSTAASPAG